MPKENYHHAGAILSPCGLYRFKLWRQWEPLDGASGTALFILLNPSTADAYQDDATVRRCIAFTKAWGMVCTEIVNVFPFRATKPADLKKHLSSPEADEENACHVLNAARNADRVICGWGAHRMATKPARVLLSGVEVPLWCFGLTADGFPRHPLYLPADAQLEPFDLFPRGTDLRETAIPSVVKECTEWRNLKTGDLYYVKLVARDSEDALKWRVIYHRAGASYPSAVDLWDRPEALFLEKFERVYRDRYSRAVGE